jgi:predicted Zn finger-like uncharacterized protein
MNLATRCNACGTVFRVVRDQLRVSDGWVRCGRCQAVFNATDDLFELDELPPGDDAGPARTPAPPGEVARRVLDELAADRRQARSAAESAPSPAPARPAEGLHDEVAPAPPEAPAETPASDWEPLPGPGAAAEACAPAAETFGAVPADDGRPAVIVDWQAAPPPAGPTAMAAEPSAEPPPPLPSFVVRADRAAFWRTPRMRVALGASALLLVVALGLQVGYAGRDQIAARWPNLAPTLEDLCRIAGCRVAPLRRIDRLSVDSAGLSLLEDAQLYRLQLVLHNRADTALLAPALELSLNDAQGVLIVRRVLSGAELGLDSPVIGAGQEMPLTVMLRTSERRIAGYNLELFYP